jgi:hypothetical protein
MKIPGFTAEVSLSEVKDNYAMALRHAEEGGMVLPQNVCWTCTDYGCFPRPCLIRLSI